MARDGIKEETAKRVIFTLVGIASVLGIILTLRTSLVVLLIGAVSFAVGIFYTFGPLPISRMPLGEAFSGFFMGFVILFLSMYIHIYDKGIVYITYFHNILSLNINVLEVLSIFLISIPTLCTIANIMLANNICDIEEDIVNKRFTLPYYIGRKNALNLFAVLNYISYADILLLVVLRIAPPAVILVIFTLIIIQKHIRLFKEKPVKSETFALSVKSCIIMNVSHIILVAAALVAMLIVR
jgi:1,4-dihydroxy-2-naphthoate octaprenyltransferase